MRGSNGEARAYIRLDRGEKDRAIEQLARAARIPSNLSYGFLKLHHQWDSLRGDPRFEKIVASLAPKKLTHSETTPYAVPLPSPAPN